MIRLILGVPVLAFLVVFALSNRQPVQLGLWPTDLSVQAPLSAAMLVAMAVTFLVGGLLVWVQAMGQRRRARRAEDRARRLEAQIAELRSRRPAMVLPPPG